MRRVLGGLRSVRLNKSRAPLMRFDHKLKLATSQQRLFSWEFDVGETKTIFHKDPFQDRWESICDNAENAVESGDFDTALEHARKAVELTEQTEVRPLTLQGEILILKEQYEEALKSFDKVLQIVPQSAPAMISVANCLWRMQKHREALDHVGMVLQVYPENMEARMLRASIFIELKDKASAVQDLIAITKEPVITVDKCLVVADQLFRLQEFDVAADYYKKILERGARRWEGWYGLGMCLYAQQFYAEAIDNFNRALFIEPNQPQVCMGRALAYMQFKNFDKAFQDASVAEKHDPKNTLALLIKIYCNYQWKKWQECANTASAFINITEPIIMDPNTPSQIMESTSKQMAEVIEMQAHCLLRMYLAEKRWPRAPEPPFELPKEYLASEMVHEYETLLPFLKKIADPELERVFRALVHARKIHPQRVSLMLPLMWLRKIAEMKSEMEKNKH